MTGGAIASAPPRPTLAIQPGRRPRKHADLFMACLIQPAIEPLGLEVIRADQIDILVDLQGYTHHARTGILTFRPAPIQAQFLGYPGTMGTRLVDYLIADKFIIRESQFRHYAERIVHLLDSYQPNDPQRAIGPAPRRSEAGLPGTGVVFCSFNETYKISRAIFEVWMRLLSAVPDSVLWLMSSNRWAPENLRKEAQRLGVDAQRLIFAPRVAPAAHRGRRHVPSRRRRHRVRPVSLWLRSRRKAVSAAPR